MLRVTVLLALCGCSSSPVARPTQISADSGWLHGRRRTVACDEKVPMRPTFDLFVEPGGRAMEQVSPLDRPPESLTSVGVVYSSPGLVRWSIYGDASGAPAPRPRATVEANITAEMIGAPCAAPQRVNHRFDPPVVLPAEPVWLVF